MTARSVTDPAANSGSTVEDWKRAALRLEALLREELGHVDDIPLHSPSFGNADRQRVASCIESGWVSSVGPDVDEFESMIAAAAGTRHAIAIVNGTAALQTALVALGVQAGDAVLCPALTFIGTANAIRHAGCEPIFVDSDLTSLGINPDKLENFLSSQCERGSTGMIHTASGRRVAGIIVVDIFGHPSDIDRIQSIAEQFDVFVVEDAAEALGAEYRGRRCGSQARLSAFSFNGNKIVTTGGGGALTTDDEDLAVAIKHLTTTARLPSDNSYDTFDHDMVGYNFRLPNLNAALGCAQLANLDTLVEQKRTLHKRYADLFSDIQDVALFVEQPWAKSNYWLPALFLPDGEQRQAFLEATNSRGIATRPCWRLLSETRAYQDCHTADALEGAREIAERVVNLPGSPWLVAHL